VLIPSLYATSPRTRSLRPVRVPSDQNTRWRLPHHLSLLRDKEFLVSPYLPDIYIPSHIRGWTIAATSRTCDSIRIKNIIICVINIITFIITRSIDIKNIIICVVIILEIPNRIIYVINIIIFIIINSMNIKNIIICVININIFIINNIINKIINKL
jgi:hypothetical protein